MNLELGHRPNALGRKARNPKRLFAQAEFILSMIALENTKGEPRAYFTRYVYIFGGASKDACTMLKRDHAHLDRLFNRPLEEALRGLWHYFSSLKGTLPCPNMMARSWPVVSAAPLEGLNGPPQPTERTGSTIHAHQSPASGLIASPPLTGSNHTTPPPSTAARMTRPYNNSGQS